MPGRPLRVVIAEDDPLVRRDLTQLVLSFGHSVVAQAADPEAMALAIGRDRPDVVVFDVHLGEGDGIETFRRAGHGLDTAGVAVTGDRGLDTEERAAENNVLAFVHKPVSPEQLRSSIRMAYARALELAGLRQANNELAAIAAGPQLNWLTRAKAKLARKYGFTEAGAHGLIQQAAQAAGADVETTARGIVRDELTVTITVGPALGPGGLPPTGFAAGRDRHRDRQRSDKKRDREDARRDRRADESSGTGGRKPPGVPPGGPSA